VVDRVNICLNLVWSPWKFFFSLSLSHTVCPHAQWRRQDFVSGGHRFGVVKRSKIINVHRTTPGSNLYSRICVIVLGLCVVHIQETRKFKKYRYRVLTSSADADKPARRVWKSVKVTKHGTIRCVRYGFLLVCYSNFVRKVNLTIRLKNALKTELRVRRCHWKYHHSIERVWLPIMS